MDYLDMKIGLSHHRQFPTKNFLSFAIVIKVIYFWLWCRKCFFCKVMVPDIENGVRDGKVCPIENLDYNTNKIAARSRGIILEDYIPIMN